MPCDSVITQSVNLKNANHIVLMNALAIDGWSISKATVKLVVAYRAGEGLRWEKGAGISTSGGMETIERVTMAYSREAVTWAAKRAGWVVKQTGENKMVVSRG